MQPRTCENSANVLMEVETPGFQVEGSIVFLQGSFDPAAFGIEAQTVAFLPEGFRPRRTVRCLAPLLNRRLNQQPGSDITQELMADQSLAVTIRPDGQIAVEGGNVHSLDKKGNMRVIQQKKLGWLYLDGVRFILAPGTTVEVSTALGARLNKAASKILVNHDDEAVAFRQGNVVCLEGALRWHAETTPHPRRALGFLPRYHWPERRETFFTRGHLFAEAERCRVDIDCHGRIFCPEGGAENGHVNLCGIIFKAAEQEPTRTPESRDWDELVLQYSAVKEAPTEAYKLLESFIQRCNKKEPGLKLWKFV